MEEPGDDCGETIMKILVPVKRVVDYNVKIRVKPDKRALVGNVKMSMNLLCEIVVEEAVPARGGNRNRNYCCFGRPDTSARNCTALAMGADRGILVKTDDELEPLGIAKVLKAVVEASPDLVILGKQAIDGDNNQTRQMLAALLGWSQGTFQSRAWH